MAKPTHWHSFADTRKYRTCSSRLNKHTEFVFVYIRNIIIALQIVYEQSFGSYESGLVIDNEHFYTSECQLDTKDEFLSSSLKINQVLIEDAIKLLQ